MKVLCPDETYLHSRAMKSKSTPSLLPKMILVPCDFSDCSVAALAQAAALAKLTGGTLVLLHVIEPVTPGFLIEGTVSRQTQGQMRARVANKLSALARTHAGGVHLGRPLIKAGKPWEIIVSTASKAGVDLIVLGTHGYTGLKHAVLGSVAERVVRHSSCPVLTVPSKPRRR